MNEMTYPADVELHEYEHCGIHFDVYTNENTLKYYSGCPWRFRIYHPERGVIHFAGMPNYCHNRASAIMRAIHRCRWIASGQYDLRYK